jgi:hypothetical protein
MNEIQQIELVDEIAERIRRWGVTDLASALLEGLRPVAFIGGQALWIAQPALGLVMEPEQVADYARLLERPEALDLLRARLEECQV